MFLIFGELQANEKNNTSLVVQDLLRNGEGDSDDQRRGRKNQTGGRKGMTFSVTGSRT